MEKSEKLIKRENWKRLYRQHLKLIDFIVAFALFLNFGALFLTISLVDFNLQRQGPVERIEANFLQTDFKQVVDLDISQEEKNLKQAEIMLVFFLLLRTCFFWAFLLLLYYISRNRLATMSGFYTLFFFVSLYFMIICFDFTNNLALFISDWRFAGC